MNNYTFYGVSIILGLAAIPAQAVSVPIGHPSFEDQEGFLVTGFENGWTTGNGLDGGVWGASWLKYESSLDKDGPYQALNTLYEANKVYSLKFHARLESGSFGKVAAHFLYLNPGDAWWNGSYVGCDQTFVLSAVSTEWTELTLTYIAPASGHPVGKKIVVYFTFPAAAAATQIRLDDVSLECVPQSVTNGQLALGKTYTLFPAPNYEYCTDAGDATQLTDGVVYSGGDQLWLQPSTVGWSKDQACSPVIVTIDLGAVKPISGAAFHTYGGSGDVEFPEAIFILTSDDGQNFEYIGDLAALGTPPSAGGYKKYETHGLQTFGRYVRMVLTLYNTFTFVDEIEVYEGDPAWLTQSRGPLVDFNPFVSGKMMTWGVRRTMRKNVNDLRNKANGSSISSSAKAYINSELDAVAGNIPYIDVPYSTTFKAILPFNSDHERLFKAQAWYWDALGRSGVRAWNSALWGLLSPLDDPPAVNGANVSMDMMIGEYRAGSFNLSNATQTDKAVSLTITGLPGGTNPSYITVHDVLWTDTRDNWPVAAALPTITPADGAYPVIAKSGLTKQIWLTFHPVGIAPGSYTGQIQLRGEVTIDIPITFTLRDCTFPARPTLGFGGYDYVNNLPSWYAVTPANKGAFLAQLKEHFVNCPWSGSAVMPSGTFNSAGNLIVWPSTANFNAWVADWPASSAGYYYVFLNCGDSIGQFSITDPTFNTAVRSWVNFWATYIRNKGLDPAKFRLLITDEPSLADAARITAWANAIHAANKGFKVFEETFRSNYSEIDPAAFNLCDILAPERQVFLMGDPVLRDYYLNFGRTAGKELQFYSCWGPIRPQDPYSYYRLTAWSCWKTGATAMHFWSFGQTAVDWYGGQAAPAIKSSWNEYVTGYLNDCNQEFVPFFMDATTITPAKHMEACREGVEDYEYFVILKTLVDEAVALGKSGEPLTRSQNLLATLPDQVLTSEASYIWADTGVDRTAADRARSQLLGAIVDMKNLLQFPGDANRDGSVDVSDLGILAAHYGLTAGATWTMGDFNHDGRVDVSDLGILAANYGTGTGATLDFNADAKALGLSAEVETDSPPEISTLGCHSAGLPLIAGFLLAGLILMNGVKIREQG